ncbi:hypothetical protein ACVWZV_003682 [Bradyrhizobium sp. GM5.1]
MNIRSNPDKTVPAVTTGPLPSSRKIFASPDAAPDLRVPLREIILSEGAGEPNLPVYDTSGPYTDPSVTIDVNAGLARGRKAWVLERGGVEEYQGRQIKPEDNGSVSTDKAARAFSAYHQPLRGRDGHKITQLEFARAGIITKEMIYVAARENLGRKEQLERAESSPCRRRKLWRGSARLHHPGVRPQRDRAGTCHHPLQHQPRRTRANDHRPQLPDQDQRQYRQLGGDVIGRGRG